MIYYNNCRTFVHGARVAEVCRLGAGGLFSSLNLDSKNITSDYKSPFLDHIKLVL